MIRFIVPLSLSALLISCGGESESTDTDDAANETDTSVVEEIVIPPYSEDLLALFGKSQIEDSTLAELDSIYISEADFESEEHTLSGEDVLMLSKNLLDNRSTSSNSWQIEDFLKLDTLKRKGEYKDYLDNLDLGGMARTEASAVQLLTLDDSTDIFLWVLDYSSYEACPYYSGTTIYGSLFVNREFRNTATLGDISGGGDPPVWGGTMITSKITDSRIEILEFQEFGDEIMTEDEEWVIEETKDEYHHVVEIIDGFLKETETDYESDY